MRVERKMKVWQVACLFAGLVFIRNIHSADGLVDLQFGLADGFAGGIADDFAVGVAGTSVANGVADVKKGEYRGRIVDRDIKISLQG